MKRSLIVGLIGRVACLCATAQDANTDALRSAVEADPFAQASEYIVDLTAYGPRDWAYPLPGARPISPYGNGRNHAGTDLKNYNGNNRDTIRAAFAGLVVQEGPYFAYGNFIVIRHANGLETAYSHNSRNLVGVGQWVDAGAAIAIVGQTGRASTPHLHFETRAGGQAFDSSILFDHQANRLRPVRLSVKRQGRIAVRPISD